LGKIFVHGNLPGARFVAVALRARVVLAFVFGVASGALIGAYREPLGGRPLVLASLKIDEAAAFLDP
jgi:hypothetical protein